MLVPPHLILITFVSSLVHPGLGLTQGGSLWRRASVPPEGFFNPINNNGSMITSGFLTSPEGLGEPLNALISANSDPDVLKDLGPSGGLLNYFLSFQFSPECLGQHLGSHQMADLGDGDGRKNETAVMRYNFNDTSFGACKESVQGGNHFRYWVQNGTNANSQAIFMAVSYELPASQEHDLIRNGYNLARDWLVGNITGTAIPTMELTASSSYTGTTQFGGYIYQTSVNYIGGLLQNTSEGINHYLSVGGGPNNMTAQDGLVAQLTVKIIGRPSNTPSAAVRSWTFSRHEYSLPCMLLLIFLLVSTVLEL